MSEYFLEYVEIAPRIHVHTEPLNLYTCISYLKGHYYLYVLKIHIPIGTIILYVLYSYIANLIISEGSIGLIFLHEIVPKHWRKCLHINPTPNGSWSLLYSAMFTYKY